MICRGLLNGSKKWKVGMVFPISAYLFCLSVGMMVSTWVKAADTAAASDSEWWRIEGQFTNVSQWHPDFHAPYSSLNSMKPDEGVRETTDATLYAGIRLSPNTEAWINPEIDQGFGLSNTLGAAGYPSGEAYKIGAHRPYLRIQRAFVRHVISLGGQPQKIDPAPNQLGGTASSNNVTVTVGKFSVVDIFDTNGYAHDPRADFLNWSVIDAGAFDYAADAWGYTFGAEVEWTRDWWTLRAGAFQMSQVPNAKIAGFHPRQHMFVTEFEGRYTWQNRPGKIKLLAFVDQANMAKYSDALRLARSTGSVPDVSPVRYDQSRPGVVFNLEQDLVPYLGTFVRASVNDGTKETYEFTEINRSIAVGLSLKGRSWGRDDDGLGFAAAVNALSADARAYFAAGGMGILIGDGALNYGPEKILESYYSLQLNDHSTLSINFQHLRNPAYNRDRGPINIGAFRLHVHF